MKLAQEDHPLALNCPRCPIQMRYHGITPEGMRVYSCPNHGEWLLRDGELFQPHRSVLDDNERAK